MTALPADDPAYVELEQVLSRRFDYVVGDVQKELLDDLLDVVAGDRARRAFASVPTTLADLDPEQRLAFGDDPDEDEPLESVWVNSEISPLGVYICTITYPPDIERTLLPDQVEPYANAIEKLVARAEYDAAVLRQLTTMVGMDLEDAGKTVLELRDGRPPVDQKPMRPLIMQPSVGFESREPYVVVKLAGTKKRWRWEPAAAREHVAAVRGASIVADLDAGYRRALATIGIDDRGARRMVTKLADWRNPY